jgi:prepilin-type N-terminal cleavage/methylation domain-containing protein
MKKAFTLIEILIATMLLSIVLLSLYSVLDVQRRSVGIIKASLDNSLKQDKIIMTLYNDIYKSDGNFTLKKGERDTLCINATTNSLYGLGIAKVCWLVLKDGDSLTRIEGVDYKLPLKFEDRVEADIVAKGVKLFDIYYDKKSGNILALLQEAKKEPYSFLIQGKIPPPKPKPKKKKKPQPAEYEKNRHKGKKRPIPAPPSPSPAELF